MATAARMVTIMATATTTITMDTAITMDNAALFKLAAWLSPAYPVGAYTYSHGLEWAVEAGDVKTLPDLMAWVEGCLRYGGGRSDAILLAQAWQAGPDAARLREIAEFAAALVPSSERHLETLAQGRAFVRAGTDVWPVEVEVPPETVYPVAVGTWAAAHGCPLQETAVLYLQAFCANIISAGVRIIPLGQTDGQRCLAALREPIGEIASTAVTQGLDDIGGCAFRADLASMYHETQYTRLFRS